MSEIRAVVLAGGKGQRLYPYTTILPKPLLPIGEQPILHHVLSRLKEFGFKDVTISVGHLAELIMLFFKDGKDLGLQIEYAKEEEPLGTIGPLCFIDNLGDDFLVMNGDVLTDLDFNALKKAHFENEAILTIATHRRQVNIDFGVLKTSPDGRIDEFVEKPSIPYEVSMGVYMLNRKCLDYVPKGQPFGFDQLVLKLLEKKEKVHAHRHDGKWLDLGRPSDYELASRDYTPGETEETL